MPAGSKSCLIEKLSYYIDLGDEEERHLSALEDTERVYRRHHEVYSEGDEVNHLSVVKEGWLYVYTDMPDGRRQIVRVYHPGDIIGLPDIAFDQATSNLRTCEEVRLCPFPKDKLDVVFRESPRLTALLFTIANRELACMVDMLRAMGRMSARERLAFLFLDFACRLRITNRSMTDTFRLPLNQHEIGDVLGLTHTYVSKTVRQMEDDGLISRSGDMLTLERESALRSLVEFKDRYKAIDVSWFPERGS